MSFLVDEAAAALKPSADKIRQWAFGQRIFVSSVMEELARERQHVVSAIERFGAQPVWFEKFGGMDQTPNGSFISELSSCLIYVGILGRTYGQVMPSGYSATQEEYNAALERNLRICIWTHLSEDFQGDQNAFVQRVRRFHTTGTYSSPEDLAEEVTLRLERICAEDLSIWVKLGSIVFRASQVEEAGNSAVIHASISSPVVLAALENLRPTAYRRNELQLTYRGVSFPVLIEDVKCLTSSNSSTIAIISLAKQADRDRAQNPLHSLSVVKEAGRTYTSDQITKMRVRSFLFGEEVTLGWGFGAVDRSSITEALAMELPLEVHTALIKLIVTEYLVVNLGISRLPAIQISPPHPVSGKRRIGVTWIKPLQGGSLATPESTEGELSR